VVGNGISSGKGEPDECFLSEGSLEIQGGFRVHGWREGLDAENCQKPMSLSTNIWMWEFRVFKRCLSQGKIQAGKHVLSAIKSGKSGKIYTSRIVLWVERLWWGFSGRLVCLFRELHFSRKVRLAFNTLFNTQILLCDVELWVQNRTLNSYFNCQTRSKLVVTLTW